MHWNSQHCYQANLLKLIDTVNTISAKILAGFLRKEINKLKPKLIGICKGPRKAKTVFRNNKFGRLLLPDFRTFYKAIGIKIVRTDPQITGK